jgi:hypothetical protein
LLSGCQAGAWVSGANLELAESSLVAFRPDRNDDINVAIVSLFPNCAITQISNNGSIYSRFVFPATGSPVKTISGGRHLLW